MTGGPDPSAPPLVVLRADASAEMGTGHVARCLSLADELRGRGFETGFASRLHAGHLADVVEAHGHRFAGLPLGPAPVGGDLAHAAWLGADQGTDLAETLGAFERLPAVVVVDHYGIDAWWERGARAAGAVVVAVDGIADRAHDADLLVDPTFDPAGPDRWQGLIPGGRRVLAGPRYAFLSPRFRPLAGAVPPRDRPPERIVVAFGGADPGDATALALDAIDGLGRPRPMLDVIIGANYRHPDVIRERGASMGGVVVHHGSDQVPELMAAADVAVGTGGTMMWERCYLGLPSVVVAIAAHQVDVDARVAAAGAIVDLGPQAGVTPAALGAALADLLADGPRRVAMGHAARAVMGGSGALGVELVADEVEALLAAPAGGRS